MDLQDHNLLMYAAPLDTRVVFRPLWVLRMQHSRGTPLPDSFTVLVRRQRPMPQLPGFRRILLRLSDLPSGWRVVEFYRSPR